MASNAGAAASKSFHRAERQFISNGHSLSSSSSSLSKSVDGSLSVRNKSMTPPPRRSATPNPRPRSRSRDDDGSEPARVRVAIRVRPKTSGEEADFTDCVELQPELKRLKLIKNNWNSESYQFDEVFSETASQRRVYEVVAKPVVESVLNGFNGTVMAYGQTGTGKTYTIGRLGKEDVSERGIIVRALEDIIASTSGSSDIVEVSYLQLYLESVQDLLAPERTNIPIVEDHKTGEVTLPGASVVKILDVDHFLQVLQLGESNRQVANTRMNTESSRSHAIFMIYVRRSIHEKEENHIASGEKRQIDLMGEHSIPAVRKSKMLIVDLAGSERLNKSGSEGHLVEETKFINLSLTSLGKCINALAENSPHIPTRDSKLTRLLRDSFGGSARTSLIVTISPSSRHLAETTSTIMFGQRAMKVMNMVKLKEEFDYESYCRKLGNELEHLTAEVDRQQKARDSMKIEMEIKLKECQKFFADAERSLILRSEFLEKENNRLETEMKAVVNELIHVKDHNAFMLNEVDRLQTSVNQRKQQELEHLASQQVLADTIQMYETKILDLVKQLSGECARCESSEAQLDVMKKQEYDHQRSMQHYQVEISSYQKALADTTQLYEKKIKDLEHQLDDMHAQCEGTNKEPDRAETYLHGQQNTMQLQRQEEIDELEVKLKEIHGLNEITIDELESLRHEYNALLVEKVMLKDDICGIKHDLEVEESKRKAAETELLKFKKLVPGTDDDFEDKTLDMNETAAKTLGLHKTKQSREIIFGQRATIAKLCEEVGLEKILHLLSSCDVDVQIHAVKMVANLAAEDNNQEKIVAEGGLDALLMLLQTSENTTILRVTSGAVANLAMNEVNQNLIMSKGGGPLLAMTSSKTNDPQTLRMVAGAIANLCGNEKLHAKLVEDGTIKSLLGMVRSGNNDVIAQVARGLANFSKCESRGITKGQRKGRSLLIGDGALTWLIANTTTSTVTAPTRRHIELALCHLAQNEDNAKDFIYSGGVKELERISKESIRDDIRNLAKKILNMNPLFKAQILRAFD